MEADKWAIILKGSFVCLLVSQSEQTKIWGTIVYLFLFLNHKLFNLFMK